MSNLQIVMNDTMQGNMSVLQNLLNGNQTKAEAKIPTLGLGFGWALCDGQPVEEPWATMLSILGITFLILCVAIQLLYFKHRLFGTKLAKLEIGVNGLTNMDLDKLRQTI